MPKTAAPRVAFQGEFGAFSHMAVEKLLGESAAPRACASFPEVFKALHTRQVDFAVIAIENTLHGSIHENYDLLLESNAVIIGETSVRIAHQLITMPDVPWRQVKRAFSHPVALNQCRSFFAQHPEIEPVSFYDTAGSVKMLEAEQPEGAAAIASERAAAIYGGVIRKRNIQDDKENYTRFFLLARKASNTTGHSGSAKTTLVFTTPNRPGALFKALACFALRDITLTKIESRPLRGKPWEYLFYVDLLGASTDGPIENALRHLSELTEFSRILGSYVSTP